MNRRTALVAAAILVFTAQAISSHFLRRDPFLPSPPPLATLPAELGVWSDIQDEVFEPAVLDKLGPDDYLARQYQLGRDGDQAEIFVAYYKTQLRDKQAHDPKVCLPGAGWNPTSSRQTEIPLGASKSIPVNYYRIKKDDNEQVVIYWFQTFSGVYTLEQQLKAHRIWDAIVTNRTDMALVRIIAPVTSKGVESADANATQLAKAVYKNMLSFFPPTERSGS